MLFDIGFLHTFGSDFSLRSGDQQGVHFLSQTHELHWCNTVTLVLEFA